MSDENVQRVVSQAVGVAYEQWAAEHPSLAAVIDRVALSRRVVESLRDSAEYRSAIAAYHAGQAELDLLGRLADLALPVLTAILGG